MIPHDWQWQYSLSKLGEQEFLEKAFGYICELLPGQQQHVFNGCYEGLPGAIEP